MSDRTRLIIFAIAVAVLGGVFCRAAWNMPSWGEYRGPYGDVIAQLTVYQRHTNDVVNAINYDYRAFDTLGEEFIMFTAVLGVMVLLRREEGSTAAAKGTVQDTHSLSETVRATTVTAILFTVVFGLYVCTHGQLSPGGGFAGGVILATAVILVYVAVNPKAFQRLASHAATEVLEALGAGSYALIGLVPLLYGRALLTNVLPLGKTGDVFSSGTIGLISTCVGVEVTAAILLVSYTYLAEIMEGSEPE